jgi:murein L,D-transpeptidase YcbB/YkuD
LEDPLPLHSIAVALLLALSTLAPAAPPATLGPAPALAPADRAAVVAVLTAAPDDGLPGLTVQAAAAADDAVLRAAALAYARAQYGGRLTPSRINHEWALKPGMPDLAVGYAAAAAQGQAGAWLRASAPADPRYRALLLQRRLYAGLSWGAVPAGPTLRPGAKSPRIEALRTRLLAEGYALPAAPDPKADPKADPTVMDAALAAALALFQTRHGLPADGALGPATVKALNVPAAARLEQIDANLERWRWAPRNLPDPRVEVDVAGQTVTLFVHGAPQLAMRAIVGRSIHRTPLFASTLRAVVFNPPWIVPTSIAVNELWPKERARPGYLARSGILQVNGGLMQPPGPTNPLGVVKFDFDSPFGVYLHDTNARGLFARPARALSHGCVRIEKPRELALYLLGQEGWTEERIDAAIAAGTTRRVGLAHATPIYVFYWTVAVGDDGAAAFRPDIYGWDAKLTAALARAAVAK